MSQALERVRQVARQRKKEKFTALLHHVGVDLLGGRRRRLGWPAMAVVPPKIPPPGASSLAPVPTIAAAKKIRAAHKASQLQFFGRHAHLAQPKAFAAYLAPLRKIEWTST